MNDGFAKKRVKSCIVAILVVGMLLLTACGKQESGGTNGTGAAEAEGKISVVTSIYPIYYLAGEIGGTHANIVNLIPAGVDPHDWSPKSRDLELASKARLLLYNGAGLEGWVHDFLEGLGKNKQVEAVETSSGIILIDGENETEGEHEEDHAEEEHAGEDKDSHEAEGHAEEGEHADEDDGHSHTVDPHTWVSPKSALMMAENIKNSFVKADPGNEAAYEANYETLRQKLSAVDAKYTEELSGTAQRNIVVSHEAFGYLCRDYGLNQVAIMGLSGDAEPRAQDLLRISKFVKEHGIKYIFFEELVSDQLAQTLARETKVETLVLNPLEGLTPEQEKAGEDLMSLMELNLQNLLKALQ